MPNWCENQLTVTGDVTEFYEKFTNMKAIVPMPADTKDWYHWAIENWGVKWDFDAIADSHDDDFLYYVFETAWGPPTKFIKKAALLYPDLYFVLKYDEPGMGFMGCCTAKGPEFKDTTINY